MVAISTIQTVTRLSNLESLFKDNFPFDMIIKNLKRSIFEEETLIEVFS